jgi:lipopolysaccharide assembly outer membrane protein LptD (OstA)
MKNDTGKISYRTRTDADRSDFSRVFIRFYPFLSVSNCICLTILFLLIGNAFGLQNEISPQRRKELQDGAFLCVLGDSAVQESETGNPQSAIENPQSKEEIRFSADVTEGSRIGEHLVKTYKGNVTVAHGETILHADEATFVQSEKKVLLRGHVSAADSSTGRCLYADEATYYQSDEKVALWGRVSVEDSLSRITSDRMIYLVSSKELTAQDEVVATYGKQTIKARRLKTRWEEKAIVAEGRVEFVDEENRLTLTCGRIEYDDRAQFGRATRSPRLIRRDESGEGFIAITADTMAVHTEENKTVAVGNVHLVKDRLEAFCDSAAYFQKEEKVLLRVSPRAVQRTGDPEKGAVLRINELTGETIELTLKDDVPVEVAVFGEARATTTSLDSLGAETPDTSFLKGRTITMKLKAEKLEEMAVSGNAVSRYRTSQGENREPAENDATGDRIVLFFDGGTIARVLIEGGVLGTYYFASE